MIYRLEVAPAAEAALRRLDAAKRSRIATRLRSLADDPRPPGAKRLSGCESLWRVRVGSYRVVYQIQDDRRVVLVLELAIAATYIDSLTACERAEGRLRPSRTRSYHDHRRTTLGRRCDCGGPPKSKVAPIIRPEPAAR